MISLAKNLLKIFNLLFGRWDFAAFATFKIVENSLW